MEAVEMDLKKLLNEARIRANLMDKIDHDAGYATPADVGAMHMLRTGIGAIECGITRDEWDAVADGLLLLHQCRDSVVVLGKVRRG
jgi:hypothetical protein